MHVWKTTLMRIDEVVNILNGTIQVLLMKGKDDDELRILADGLSTILQQLLTGSDTAFH